ncbi:SDR family NAD(P)-dependent oxidoreductase [Streptomyces megasporus]|uniref:SDR family NAD(P)-dependent oxidoreductase n=1 Tax=Streptomyces megasporus TaxID=44060 RepID=UPI000AC86422|nr:SDR family NAD(P)-dependent oxidoreductase [Streptomyces megasporus]
MNARTGAPSAPRTPETPEQWAALRAPLGSLAVLDTSGSGPGAAGRADGADEIAGALGAGGLRVLRAADPEEDARADVYCALLVGNDALGCADPSPGLDRPRIRRVAEAMADRGAGRLVLVTDASSDTHLGSDPDRHGGLAADRAWWQRLAASLAPRGVVANTVQVGHAPFLGHRLAADRAAGLLRYQALRRPTAPEDVASCLSLLTSRGCSYLVAETLRADGGMDLGVIPAIRDDQERRPAAPARRPTAPPVPPGAAGSRDFEGLRVLIAGASSGIGRACALHLAERGADVVLAARRTTELEAVAHAVEGFGRRAHILRCDLADADEAGDLAGLAWKAAERLDCLLYAAGHLGFASGPGDGPGETDPARTTFAVNLRSFVTVTDELAARWADAGIRGSVAGVASVSSTFSPVPHLEHYGASKAAMIQYARCLAVSRARFGIRANCVAPGIIDTPMGDAAGPEHRRGWISRIPAGRVGRPHEVATVLGHLLSPSAAHLTGVAPRVDGGFGLLGAAPLWNAADGSLGQEAGR